MVHHFLAREKSTSTSTLIIVQARTRIATSYNTLHGVSCLVYHALLSDSRIYKFSPDWCFSLFKQAYRRTKIGCLDNIVRVVEKSAEVYHVQLVGTQDGRVPVPMYDWAAFFDHPFDKEH